MACLVNKLVSRYSHVKNLWKFYVFPFNVEKKFWLQEMVSGRERLAPRTTNALPPAIFLYSPIKRERKRKGADLLFKIKAAVQKFFEFSKL